MDANRSFRCFIVVCNPKSTNARNTERRIAELRTAAPKAEVIVVETSAQGYTANTKLLRPYADKLGKHTLLCIAAGDGTVNSMIEGLLSDPALPDVARQTPILPLWCGNANDLAHMLNGRAYQTRLAHLLNIGKIIKIYPIACKLTDKNGRSEVRLAACYISFGASAFTTQVLSKAIRSQTMFHRWPMGRFLQELSIVIAAMRQAPMFAANEDSKQKNIFEYIFFNGSRFAKVEGVKRKLADKSFHRTAVERKRFSDVMVSIFKLTRRDSHELETTHTTFTALEATWAQFDGESADISAGTTVEITVASKPFYALATKK